MKNKPIIIVAGEPNSIFLEIFFKTIKRKKFKRPLVLICSKKLLKLQMNKLKFKKKVKIIKIADLKNKNLNNNFINLIDVKYNQNSAFQKISSKSKNYIKKSFNIAFKIIKLGLGNNLVNGPISKKKFLNKKFLGITEYISDNFSSKNNAMLIFNKNLSVCPLTTHLPIKLVSKNINKELIIQKVKLINTFYKNYLNYKPKIAVTGLNPHCESNEKSNEDINIIKPSVKYLKNIGFNISGPYAADTIFLKKNRVKFNVIIGMYHDQVLGPLKTLYEYNAINITLGLPFVRISPDHGPNEDMVGKNISNPLSLMNSFIFLDKN
jgi:4-hydroxythreonine-4-phosphate dehydrogenase